MDGERLGSGAWTGVVLISHCNMKEVLIVLVLAYDPPKDIAVGTENRAGGRAIVIFASTKTNDRTIDAIVGDLYQGKRRGFAGGAEARPVGSGGVKGEVFLFLRPGK